MISLRSRFIACCKLAPIAKQMWRHNYVIDRNEYLIFTLSESSNTWVYSHCKFLFKSTNNSWRYERKCEWVFFLNTVYKSKYTVWVKKSPHCDLRFSDIFHKRLRIFTHLLYVLIYARLQIFIQLSHILTKLCQITRDCLLPISHNMLKMSTVTIGRNACVQTFAKVVDTIRYDTIGEFNVDWKAEYSALSSTRSQKKKLKQPTPVPL